MDSMDSMVPLLQALQGLKIRMLEAQPAFIEEDDTTADANALRVAPQLTVDAAKVTSPLQGDASSPFPSSPVANRSGNEDVDVASLAESIERVDPRAFFSLKKPVNEFLKLLRLVEKRVLRGGGCCVECLFVMYEIVQSFVVYANMAIHVRSAIASLEHARHLISLCDAARLAMGSQVPQTQQRSGDEIWRLRQCLHNCGLSANTQDTLLAAYTLEYLADAALPPAICSGRYDGLATVVDEKRSAVAVDLILNRNFLGGLVKNQDIARLHSVYSFAASATPKYRTKLLERLVAEGLLPSLADALSTSSLSTVASCLDLLQLHVDMTSNSSDVTDRACREVCAVCPSWVSHPEMPRLLEAIIGVLGLCCRPCQESQRCYAAAAKDKVVLVLRSLLRLGSVAFDLVLSSIDGVLHQYRCPFVGLVLAIVVDISQSPLAIPKEALLGEWYRVISEQPPLGPRVPLARKDELDAIPFLQMSAKVAETACSKAFTYELFTKALQCARLVKESSERHKNLAHAVACKCIAAVSPYVTEGECVRGEGESRKRERSQSSPEPTPRLQTPAPISPEPLKSSLREETVSPQAGLTWRDRTFRLFTAGPMPPQGGL